MCFFCLRLLKGREETIAVRRCRAPLIRRSLSIGWRMRVIGLSSMRLRLCHVIGILIFLG